MASRYPADSAPDGAPARVREDTARAAAPR